MVPNNVELNLKTSEGEVNITAPSQESVVHFPSDLDRNAAALAKIRQQIKYSSSPAWKKHLAVQEDQLIRQRKDLILRDGGHSTDSIYSANKRSTNNKAPVSERIAI